MSSLPRPILRGDTRAGEAAMPKGSSCRRQTSPFAGDPLERLAGRLNIGFDLQRLATTGSRPSDRIVKASSRLARASLSEI